MQTLQYTLTNKDRNHTKKVIRQKLELKQKLFFFNGQKTPKYLENKQQTNTWVKENSPEKI